VPDRGLVPLLHAFRMVSEMRDVELDVFSSYRLYGWPDYDDQHHVLYDALREHPRVRYHGAADNLEVRAVLQRAHIHAHPSVVPETSCLALIEAMSAGLVCVHPNLGALYETAAGHTAMYAFDEDPAQHVRWFASHLVAAVDAVRAGGERFRRDRLTQKDFADRYYDIDHRAREWQAMLLALAGQFGAG
jgi:glycosyltransferase involved in cell wall biosynthesis